MLSGIFELAGRLVAAYHGASPATPQSGAGMSVSWPIVAIAALAVAGYLVFRSRRR